jgi:hypothetical protein
MALETDRHNPTAATGLAGIRSRSATVFGGAEGGYCVGAAAAAEAALYGSWGGLNVLACVWDVWGAEHRDLPHLGACLDPSF